MYSIFNRYLIKREDWSHGQMAKGAGSHMACHSSSPSPGGLKYTPGVCACVGPKSQQDGHTGEEGRQHDHTHCSMPALSVPGDCTCPLTGRHRNRYHIQNNEWVNEIKSVISSHLFLDHKSNYFSNYYWTQNRHVNNVSQQRAPGKENCLLPTLTLSKLLNLWCKLSFTHITLSRLLVNSLIWTMRMMVREPQKCQSSRTPWI